MNTHIDIEWDKEEKKRTSPTGSDKDRNDTNNTLKAPSSKSPTESNDHWLNKILYSLHGISISLFSLNLIYFYNINIFIKKIMMMMMMMI